MSHDDGYERVMGAIQQHRTRSSAGPAPSESAVIPPMLYLPVRRSPTNVESFEIRPLPDGRRALLAFTALDRLIGQCGAEQPWIVVQLEALSTVMEAQPFDLVSFDPIVSGHLVEKGRLL